MAEKLQSKVKLRSGEVVTIDHVKPSKSTPKTSKSDAKDDLDEKPKTPTSQADANDDTKTEKPENEQSKVAPKETK